VEGNLVTAAAFVLFVPIALVVCARTSAPRAVAIVIVGGTLLLPELAGFKLPGVAMFEKIHIMVSWTFIGCLIWHRARLRVLTKSKLIIALFVGSAIAAFGTTITNSEPLIFGPSYVQAIGFVEVVRLIADDWLYAILPFALGFAVFRTSDDAKALMRVFVGAMLLYTVLVWVEIRLSPQFHNWVYGYAQHDFSQTIREGGYRPMVFMSHGLALGMALAMSTLFALTLHKAKERFRGRKLFLWFGVYLGFVLWAVKSVGAFLYGVVGAPVVLFTSPRSQHWLALALAAVFFIYPVLRAAHAIPDDSMLDIATSVAGEERAASFEFRITNERVLVDRAMERVVFGWGGYCRACIFDAMTGEILSTRDGIWIISLGDRGVVGFIVRFGPLLLPIWVAFRRRKEIADASDRVLVAGLALVVAVSLLDQIPNGAFNCLPYLFAGALLGVTRGLTTRPARPRVQRPIDNGAENGGKREDTRSVRTDAREDTRSIRTRGR
jgi:hypothetical protein